MKNTLVVTAFALLGLFTACGGGALKLTTTGALVQVADKSALHPDCRVIRPVKAKGGSEDEALIYLRNEAGKMSAQKLVITNRAEIPGGLVVEAEAYGSCPSGS